MHESFVLFLQMSCKSEKDTIKQKKLIISLNSLNQNSQEQDDLIDILPISRHLEERRKHFHILHKSRAACCEMLLAGST